MNLTLNWPQKSGKERNTSSTVDILQARKLGNVPSLNQIKIHLHIRQISERREERTITKSSAQGGFGDSRNVVS